MEKAAHVSRGCGRDGIGAKSSPDELGTSVCLVATLKVLVLDPTGDGGSLLCLLSISCSVHAVTLHPDTHTRDHASVCYSFIMHLLFVKLERDETPVFQELIF